ncbi:hypothetical protein ACGF0K_34660 [Streptomyces sp. NPDC048156]|uniref:hypothetical protein n=1 Tax=Streptomyces sp. NPDC048156 TaxID=3365502 RepID=UPI003716FA59
MDVEIRPNAGVAPFRFGMPFGEAMDIARDLGATVSHQAGAEQPPGQYVLTLEDSQFQFVLFFPEDGVTRWAGRGAWPRAAGRAGVR